MRLRNFPKIIVATVMLMIVISSLQCPAQAQSLDQVVVLYDASHRPQFEANDEEGLKLMLDMVNASSKYLVKVHEGSPLNDTILEDVDVLIIASPDGADEFTQSEVSAISEMLVNGSSLLVLGDPNIDQETFPSYWSHPEFRDIGENIAVNRLLDALNITGVRFSLNHTSVSTGAEYWADTMFDYENALNSSTPAIIHLDSTTWNTNHPIFKNINELVTMTSTFKPVDTVVGIATGHDDSFAQYRKGPNTFANYSFPNMSLVEFENDFLSYSAINGTFPTWLTAFEYNGSRMIVGGSTIMFSGLKLDLPDVDERKNEQWFYQGDNRLLFMNMLDWLSEGVAEPPSAIEPMLTLSAVFIVVGVAYYLFQKRKT